MGITEKGKKGFQKVENKRTVRKFYRLTADENKRLSDYLETNGMNHAEYIRKLLEPIIKD